MATKISAKALVQELEKKKLKDRDVAYEFSNGRKFYERENPYQYVTERES